MHKKANQEILKIFGKEEKPDEKINEAICRISRLEKIDLASEDQQDYSLGIIRIWEDGDFGPLHRDNANFEVPDFKISKYQNQISCVLHLQTPEKGGELIVYKQRWQKLDEKFREIGFGYKRNVLNVSENAVIVPNQGDLMIFNPKFFHEILPTKGGTKRLTFGYFYWIFWFRKLGRIMVIVVVSTMKILGVVFYFVLIKTKYEKKEIIQISFTENKM